MIPLFPGKDKCAEKNLKWSCNESPPNPIYTQREELYQQYVQIVYRFLLSACRDPRLAEDLTQETFLRAWESLERFDHSCRISTWLCQIAKHALYQHWEKYGRERPEEPDPRLPAPEDTET